MAKAKSYSTPDVCWYDDNGVKKLRLKVNGSPYKLYGYDTRIFAKYVTPIPPPNSADPIDIEVGFTELALSGSPPTETFETSYDDVAGCACLNDPSGCASDAETFTARIYVFHRIANLTTTKYTLEVLDVSHDCAAIPECV